MHVMEHDLVMGTFTHRETYLPSLCGSVRKFLPHVPFMLQLDDLPINKNFNALRDKFKQTGKRFWIFLDDDIQFLFHDTIKVALETMIRNKYAIVGVYSTHVPDFQFDKSILKEHEVNWTPGYFQLVDSKLIGHIKADEDLPDGNTSIDTSYCVSVKQSGFKIGIAPTYVYHSYKKGSWIKEEVIEPTNRYLMGKYGQQYFDWCTGIDNILGGIPEDPMQVGRSKLIKWQSENYIAEEGKLKLHLGCGDQLYKGFINCDIDGNVDQVYDITTPATFVDAGTVDHISCHHALEHVPYRLFGRVLSEWHRLLKIGGTVDIGMPDVELVAREFLGGSEDRRWGATIYIMYGQQGPTTKSPSTLTDDDPIIEGQFHRGGLTKARLCLLLSDLGFEIVDSYHYDGNGNPSLFVLARKAR